MSRTSALRLLLGLSAILDGTLALWLALAGTGLLTHITPTLGHTKGREEFASSMLVTSLGFGTLLVAMFLGALAVGCCVVYRRVSRGHPMGRTGAIFLAVAITPPILVLIHLVKALL
jgi:hypothetical protein